jgi:cleavage and polyadenylation specificity factor subunit 2
MWAENPLNLVIFTLSSIGKCLARDLMENPTLKEIHIETFERIPLQGGELKRFYREKKEKEEEDLAKKALAEYMKKREEIEIESDDEDAEQFEEGISNAAVLKEMFWADYNTDLVIKHDADPRNFEYEPLKPNYKIFPSIEKRMRYDEYGEFVRSDDFADKALQKEQEAEALRVKMANESAVSKEF